MEKDISKLNRNYPKTDALLKEAYAGLHEFMPEMAVQAETAATKAAYGLDFGDEETVAFLTHRGEDEDAVMGQVCILSAAWEVKQALANKNAEPADIATAMQTVRAADPETVGDLAEKMVRAIAMLRVVPPASGPENSARRHVEHILAGTLGDGRASEPGQKGGFGR